MGMVRLAWRSQLSSLKKGKLKLMGTAMVSFMGGLVPGGAVVPTRLTPEGMLKIAGGVKSLSRVYFPMPDNLGRKEAHASSTRAAAPRRFSSEALAFQLVAAARAAT